MEKLVPLGLSNKHIHLSKEDLDILFGEGYELTNMKDLVQPGQYACEETVEVVGPKGSFPKVRVLGPTRPETQLEISIADGVKLGEYNVPVRASGKLADTPGFELKGPAGSVKKDYGMIVAERHIHLSASEGEEFGLKDGEVVSVKLEGPRGLIFNNVLVRTGDGHKKEMHLDLDEGNAAGAKNGDVATIL